MLRSTLPWATGELSRASVMSSSRSERVLAALALVVLGGALAVTTGAATPTTESKDLRTARKAHGFPRTYHVFGGGHDLSALARYDVVVGYAYWDLRTLRARNPNGIFLLNAGLQPTSPRDYRGVAVTYGGIVHWKGGVDRIRGGPKLGAIRAFDPFWDELHNADGSRSIVSSAWGHGGWNLADPKRKGTPDLVAKVIAHAGKLSGLYARGWDGLHSDNWIYRIGVGWFYGSNLDTDRDGRVDDYHALRRHWAKGLTRVGSLLRRYLPGKIVGGNGNWSVRPAGGVDFRPYLGAPDDHLRTANYTLLEDLQLHANRTDEIIDIVGEWLGYKDPFRQPRYFAIMHRLRGERDFKSMRWGLSLATIAGAYYEAYARSHDDRFWYDEYDGGNGVRSRHWLGKPLSGPQELANGVWRRNYRHGVVLHNSTSSPQRVDLGGVYRRLAGVQDPSVNDGGTVSEVTVPSMDGLFLRRQ
jgi:Hypothetical glycosyl hydrolase family 15